MVSRNNIMEFAHKTGDEMPIYGLRKLSMGFGSVMLGTMLYAGINGLNNNVAHASVINPSVATTLSNSTGNSNVVQPQTVQQSTGTVYVQQPVQRIPVAQPVSQVSQQNVSAQTIDQPVQTNQQPQAAPVQQPTRVSSQQIVQNHQSNAAQSSQIKHPVQFVDNHQSIVSQGVQSVQAQQNIKAVKQTAQQNNALLYGQSKISNDQQTYNYRIHYHGQGVEDQIISTPMTISDNNTAVYVYPQGETVSADMRRRANLLEVKIMDGFKIDPSSTGLGFHASTTNGETFDIHLLPIEDPSKKKVSIRIQFMDQDTKQPLDTSMDGPLEYARGTKLRLCFDNNSQGPNDIDVPGNLLDTFKDDGYIIQGVDPKDHTLSWTVPENATDDTVWYVYAKHDVQQRQKTLHFLLRVNAGHRGSNGKFQIAQSKDFTKDVNVTYTVDNNTDEIKLINSSVPEVHWQLSKSDMPTINGYHIDDGSFSLLQQKLNSNWAYKITDANQDNLNSWINDDQNNRFNEYDLLYVKNDDSQPVHPDQPNQPIAKTDAEWRQEFNKLHENTNNYHVGIIEQIGSKFRWVQYDPKTKYVYFEIISDIANPSSKDQLTDDTNLSETVTETRKIIYQYPDGTEKPAKLDDDSLNTVTKTFNYHVLFRGDEQALGSDLETRIDEAKFFDSFSAEIPDGYTTKDQMKFPDLYGKDFKENVYAYYISLEPKAADKYTLKIIDTDENNKLVESDTLDDLPDSYDDYLPDHYKFVKSSVNGKIVNLLVRHEVEESSEEVPVTRTIIFNIPGQEPRKTVQHKNLTAIEAHDLVTDQYKFEKWDPDDDTEFDEVNVLTIKGYKPEKSVVPAVKVVGNADGTAHNITEIVNYVKDSALDPIKPTESVEEILNEAMQKGLAGSPDETFAATYKNLADKEINYVVYKKDTKQVVSVIRASLVNGKPMLMPVGTPMSSSVEFTRIIKLMQPAGEKDIQQSYSLDVPLKLAYYNEQTKRIESRDNPIKAHIFDAYPVPQIDGYTSSVAKVPAVEYSENMNVNQVVTVTYTKNSSTPTMLDHPNQSTKPDAKYGKVIDPSVKDQWNVIVQVVDNDNNDGIMLESTLPNQKSGSAINVGNFAKAQLKLSGNDNLQLVKDGMTFALGQKDENATYYDSGNVIYRIHVKHATKAQNITAIIKQRVMAVDESGKLLSDQPITILQGITNGQAVVDLFTNTLKSVQLYDVTLNGAKLANLNVPTATINSNSSKVQDTNMQNNDGSDPAYQLFYPKQMMLVATNDLITTWYPKASQISSRTVDADTLSKLTYKLDSNDDNYTAYLPDLKMVYTQNLNNQPDQPSQDKVTNQIRFVDDDTNEQSIGQIWNIKGFPGHSVSVHLEIPDHYELAKGQQLPTSIVIDSAGSPLLIHVVHKWDILKNDTKSLTRTINLIDVSTMKKLAGHDPIVQKLNFTRTQSKDEVTGDVKYGDWQLADGQLSNSFPAISKLPEINGYTLVDLNQTIEELKDITPDTWIDNGEDVYYQQKVNPVKPDNPNQPSQKDQYTINIIDADENNKQLSSHVVTQLPSNYDHLIPQGYALEKTELNGKTVQLILRHQTDTKRDTYYDRFHFIMMFPNGLTKILDRKVPIYYEYVIDDVTGKNIQQHWTASDNKEYYSVPQVNGYKLSPDDQYLNTGIGSITPDNQFVPVSHKPGDVLYTHTFTAHYVKDSSTEPTKPDNPDSGNTGKPTQPTKPSNPNAGNQSNAAKPSQPADSNSGNPAQPAKSNLSANSNANQSTQPSSNANSNANKPTDSNASSSSQLTKPAEPHSSARASDNNNQISSAIDSGSLANSMATSGNTSDDSMVNNNSGFNDLSYEDNNGSYAVSPSSVSGNTESAEPAIAGSSENGQNTNSGTPSANGVLPQTGRQNAAISFALGMLIAGLGLTLLEKKHGE